MKRLSYWQARAARAYRAREAGEWWDGKRWHARDEKPAPKRPKESAEAYRARVRAWVKRRVALMRRCYKSAADVLLDEVYPAMLGRGRVNGASRMRAATRFAQSSNADRKRDGRTTETADAWRTLVARVGEARLLGPLNKSLLLDCVEALTRAKHVTRAGTPWTVAGVKSFLRRRRKL